MKTQTILICLMVALAGLSAQQVPAPSQFQFVSGNGNMVATSTGPQTPGACVQIDANGNHIAGACSVAGTFYAPTAITGASFIRVQASNLATGDHDLYTVPAGKRAFIGTMNGYNNNLAGSGNNIVFYSELKVGSTYYRLAGPTTAITPTGANTATVGMALEAGDTISVNVATTNGLNVTVPVLLTANTVNIRTVRLLGPASGNNILYTVPAGKTAVLMPAATGVPFAAGPGVVLVMADSVTRTFYVEDVPSGGGSGTGYRVTTPTTGSAASRQTLGVPVTLATGDFLIFNIDAGNAAQAVWMNIIEF